MSYRYIGRNYGEDAISMIMKNKDIEINHVFSEQDLKNFLKLNELLNNKEMNIEFSYLASTLFKEHKTNIDDLKNLKKLSVLCPNFNITVREGPIYKLEDAFCAEQTVYNIAKNLNDNKDLSKFEKFLLAYDYVISRPYKSDNNHYDKDFLGVMTTDNIICEGYAKLLTKLCSYLDIECEVLIGEDATDTKHYLSDRHALCYVKLEDKKYDIDGTFLSDPTWDHIKDGKKSYDYALFPIQSVLDKNSGHSAYFHKGYDGRVETNGEYCSCTVPAKSSPVIEKDCIEKALKNINLISPKNDNDNNTEKKVKSKEEEFGE